MRQNLVVIIQLANKKLELALLEKKSKINLNFLK